MKTRLLLPVLLAALSLASAIGQPQPGQEGRPLRLPPSGSVPQPESPNLTKFSLDFPGGTPQQLVTAIEKAMAKPLNAIIPPEHADFKLPPLKMNNVNVAQLFKAIELTSLKAEKMINSRYEGGNVSYSVIKTSYGFRTPDAPSGGFMPPGGSSQPVVSSDDSIWYFYVEGFPKPPPDSSSALKVCRFYPLTAHLERGLTVNDITTAIQTGWKMLGDQDTPTISFHKETKLLIAVGDPAKLETIDAVLKALQPAPPPLRLPSPPPPAKPAEKPKTEN